MEDVDGKARVFATTVPSLPAPYPAGVPSVTIATSVLDVPDGMKAGCFQGGMGAFDMLGSVTSLFVFGCVCELLSYPGTGGYQVG